MIDCNITENFLREKDRLCMAKGDCPGCELRFFCDGVYMDYEYGKAIRVVQKWSNNHPIKD